MEKDNLPTGALDKRLQDMTKDIICSMVQSRSFDYHVKDENFENQKIELAERIARKILKIGIHV